MKNNSLDITYLKKYVIFYIEKNSLIYKSRKEILLNSKNNKYLSDFEKRTGIPKEKAIQEAKLFIVKIHKKVFDNLQKLSKAELNSLASDDSFLLNFVKNIIPMEEKRIKNDRFFK